MRFGRKSASQYCAISHREGAQRISQEKGTIPPLLLYKWQTGDKSSTSIDRYLLYSFPWHRKIWKVQDTNFSPIALKIYMWYKTASWWYLGKIHRANRAHLISELARLASLAKVCRSKRKKKKKATTKACILGLTNGRWDILTIQLTRTVGFALWAFYFLIYNALLSPLNNFLLSFLSVTDLKKAAKDCELQDHLCYHWKLLCVVRALEIQG